MMTDSAESEELDPVTVILEINDGIAGLLTTTAEIETVPHQGFISKQFSGKYTNVFLSLVFLSIPLRHLALATCSLYWFDRLMCCRNFTWTYIYARNEAFQEETRQYKGTEKS